MSSSVHGRRAPPFDGCRPSAAALLTVEAAAKLRVLATVGPLPPLPPASGDTPVYSRLPPHSACFA
eukprot:1134663-Pleurochrysis_carterae.AAC.1